ncbi:MAG: hypothetical protein NTW87_31320, partial [Planctomycetota bacterium]|nr:hypothetical protein [Planctomycetota bacterium]
MSSAEVESREILRPEARIKTIVLPQTIALSDREADVFRKFAQDGGVVVADAVCGRFDEHGRLRETPARDAVFQLDTSTEPFAPPAMNPLESVRLESGAPAGDGFAWRSAENIRNLAPVFSDRPKWSGPHALGTEYRRSPVLATSKAGGVY